MRMIHVKASTLFLIDAMGAGLSALLLGVVLPRFQNYFGMPINALYLLAAIPLFFLLYDLFCIIGAKHAATYLHIIAWANIAYCALSVAILCLSYPEMKPLGRAYFIIELLIVLALAAWQLHTAIRLGNRPH